MNKICTSLEQSQKLIELGIDVKTADMVYLRTYLGEERDYILLIDSYPEEYTEKSDGSLIPVYDEHIPAWSLTALEQLMPFHIIENNERYGFDQWKGLNSRGETYCFQYKSNIGECLYETIHWNNPLNAAFEMVCWLKENGKI